MMRSLLLALLPLLLVSCSPERGNPVSEIRPQVLFLIGEREYETKDTLPVFAEAELKPRGIDYTIIHADTADKNLFAGVEATVETDLIFLSIRRRTLPESDLATLRRQIEAGKPVVAIRTSSHAFHERNDPPPEGHGEWRDFDTAILGGRYDGHFRNKEGSEITIADGSSLVEGIAGKTFHSGGTLYRALDLAPETNVVATGAAMIEGERMEEPVAWTNEAGAGRVFYTSLGHKEDFDSPAFRTLLANAVEWALESDD